MFNDAHLHLLVNHVPEMAALAGVLLLAGGLVWKNVGVVRAGLVAFVIAGIGAAAAFYTGEPAEHFAQDQPGVSFSRTVVHRHEDAAEWSWKAEALLGVLALGALVRYRNRDLPVGVTTPLLVAGIGVAGWMMYVSHLGGQVRHPEMRDRADVIADSLEDVQFRARRLRERAEQAARDSTARADSLRALAPDTTARPDSATAR